MVNQRKIEEALGSRWYKLKMNDGAKPLEREKWRKRWIAVPAGRRSGKTERAKRFAIEIGIQRLFGDYPHDEQNYFLAAPVHDQAKSIFWADTKAFISTFDSVGLVDKSETDRRVTLHHPVRKDRTVSWRVIGLDKAERIEGIPWDGGLVDEFGNCKAGIYEQHIRPALDTIGRQTFCWLFGVPEGRNHYYDLAMLFKAKYEQDPNGPYGYYTWFSSEVLPQESIDAAREVMDPKTFAQEYEASWETKSGLVYYAWTADKYPVGSIDTSVEFNEALPVYAGFDFNVDPMTAVLGHMITAQDGPNKGKKELHLFTGYFLRNCNTKTLTERICADYPTARTFFVTPCQSSNARQTVADFGVTDWRIMEQVFHEHGRIVYKNAHTHNPLIRDRVNATNSLLHHKRIRLNPKDQGIKELVKDFEAIAYKEGTSDHDLSDPMRGHISAGLAYMVEYHFPIRVIAGNLDTSQFNA